ncbi:DsbE family thiol:disulfide interchange protein [Tropicimonas sp. IMCC34043]|uniref:DsbE family thiol:disulfide interchange protein n=1 Tax=Tropicimonas sp. IMCC34043 TaxID=2248760 RepID=UPI000E279E2D|nr:DsbE family thiol:disulfide interchange protein [Tropicimonas sp. IMCC34043]
MARLSPLMVLPPVLFLAVAGLFYAGMIRDNPDSLPTALQGQEAPALAVVPLGDAPLLTDAALREGKVTLVNFWASWCAPCRAEHPQLMRMTEQGIPVFGINYKDKDDKALGFLNDLGDPFQLSAADPQGRTGLDWGVYGVPETFVIDGTGKVVLRFAGPITSDIMDGIIMPAIAKASAPNG